MKVLAFDPGGLTGWAAWDGTHLERGYFPHFELVNNLTSSNVDLVLIEKPFLKPTTDPIVFQVYGSIRERCFTKALKVELQPASAPAFIFDSLGLKGKLKWEKSKQHDKDAFYHLLYYFVKQRDQDEVTKILEKIGVKND